MIKESRLHSIARRKGSKPQVFEFTLGHEEIKHFDFSKLRNTLTYRAMLAGPMPHGTPGKRDAISAIAEVKAIPELYPIVIELWSSNKLKVINNSFINALDDLVAGEWRIQLDLYQKCVQMFKLYT